MDVVVVEVEGEDDGALVEQLGERLDAAVGDLVVREVDRRDRDVVLEAGGEHAHRRVVEQVARQREDRQRLGDAERLGERRHVVQLHPEQRALVVHPDLLDAVRHVEVAERRHVLEDHLEVEVREELLEVEREDVVLRDGEQPRQLLRVLLERVERLEEVLEVALEVQPLPRRAVRRDLAVVPPREGRALPVALVVDERPRHLERHLRRQQLRHAVDVPRRDPSQRRAVHKVRGDRRDAELGERRRHRRLERVLVVDAREVEGGGRNHGGGARRRADASQEIAPERRRTKPQGASEARN